MSDKYGRKHTDGSRSGGQPIEPKLLTEAEWRGLWGAVGTTMTFEAWIAPYYRRGLIAPEPDARPTSQARGGVMRGPRSMKRRTASKLENNYD